MSQQFCTFAHLSLPICKYESSVKVRDRQAGGWVGGWAEILASELDGQTAAGGGGPGASRPMGNRQS